MRLNFLRYAIAALFVLGVSTGAWAQGPVSIAAVGTGYTQDFNGLAASGSGITWSNNVTLAGWYAASNGTTSITSYGTNTGSTTTAGLYSFGSSAATDRALGYMTSNGFTGAAGTGKNYMGWRFKNGTGATIDSITVKWTGEQWRRENSPAQQIILGYQKSASGGTITSVISGTWTVTTSTFTSPSINTTTAAASDGNNSSYRTVDVTITIPVSLPAGDEIMLRWEDLNDSGNDHALAIDDVTVTAKNAGAPSSCGAPSLTSDSANNITINSARLYGNVTSVMASGTGASTVARGFRYSTSSTLATFDSLSASGTGTGSYNATTPTTLTSNTTYYYRAKAYNDCSTAQFGAGAILSFVTLPAATTATAATSITANGFTANYSDVSGTGETYQVQVSTSNTFGTLAANDSAIASTSTDAITGLAGNTAYYYRVRANNAGGNGAWSNVVGPFTTLCAAPTVANNTVSSISTTAATLNGTVSAFGGGNSATANFEWGTSSTLAGATTTSNSTISSTPGAFTSSLSSLAANTRYYWRGTATNNCGTPITGYSTTSSHATFYTLPDAPTANAGGTVTTSGFVGSWNNVPGGEAETYEVQISTDNTFASGTTQYNANTSTTYNFSSLSAGTTYYYRVRATNNGASNPGAWSNTITTTTVDNNIPINAANVYIYENFNSYTGLSAASLPTGWSSSSATYLGAGTSSSSGGGNYTNVQTTGDNSLGALRTGSNDITLTANFRNTTGVIIHTLEIAYDFEQWRFNNLSGFTVSQTGLGSASVSGLSQAGISFAAAGTVAVTPKTITLTGLTLANNATFTLSWLAYDATNADNGISVDSFRIKANPVAAPNIVVTGNSTLIADASTTPSTTNFTQFLNTSIGSTSTRTYSINNTGTNTLNLTGTPRVSVSGTNASEFTVTTLPSSSVAGGAATTFVVTFAPSSTGTRTATLTILSDDPDAADATYTFDVAGTATGNTASDIVAASGFTYTTNIPYVNYTSSATVSTSNSVEVGRFTIRDGGATTDADANTTALNAITFNAGSNYASLRKLAIFDGSTFVQELTLSSATAAFSGLNLVANDNGTKDFSLRATFTTAVTDNEQFQFTVTAATANSAGSVFAAANAGGAVTSVAGNNNRIVVTADRLAFTTQPVSGSINVALAAFEVSAVDVNGNVDANATNSVTLSTSGANSNLPAAYTLVAGSVTVSNVTYTSVQNNITITATTTGLSNSNTVTSSQFNISTITYAHNDYRTTSTGNWLGSSGLATWERYNSSTQTWATSAAPASNTSNNMYIRHAITTGAAWGAVNLKIMNGGTFTNIHGGSTASIYVYTGGMLDVEATLTNNGAFDVEDNADVLLNFNFGNPSSSIWAGTENFRPNSYLLIGDWEDNGTYLINGDVTTHNYNGYTAAFGNVSIDLSSATSTWSGTWTLTGPSFGTTNITHGNLEFDSPRGYNITFSSNSGTYTAGIGGDLVLNSGWSSSRNVIISTSSATYTLNVRGNLVHNSPGTFAVRQTNAAGSSTLNVDGDIIMNGAATTATTALLMNWQSIGATQNAIRAIVNLKGNLLVGALPNISNNMNPVDVQFNFVANTNTHDVTVPTATSGIPFFIKNDATVRLVNNNLTLNNTSSLTVETGGSLNFNWTTANVPLLVTQPASPTGTNSFTSQTGTTLYITSADGITSTAGVGNVQVTPSNRTFNQTATFYYVGKTNQVTGNALGNGSTVKNVIANLATNNVTLTPSNNVGVAAGGRLEIQKGTVIGSATAEFIGGGYLVMTDGTYQMSETGLTLPQLSGYPSYALTGGTVEFNGAGAQVIATAPAAYYNVIVSGSNSGNEKTLTTGTLNINNNLTITGTPILNSVSNAVSGTGGLTMNGGRWRLSKLTTPLPELAATAAGQSYSVTGGTIEFYGSGATQSQTIRAVDGNSNQITYYNIEATANALNTTTGNLRVNTNQSVGVSNTFTVFTGASALLNMNSAVTGAGTFTVQPDAALLYGHAAGITISGATGNVQVTGTRTFPTTASYGFIGGAVAMVSGSGLPATVKNLYVNKTTGTNTVTLSNSVSLTADLDLTNGVLLLGANDITLSNTSTVTGTPSATAMVVTNGTGKFVKQYNTGATVFTYPVGDNAGTNEYSPATINFASNANAGAVGVIVTDAVHPNMGSISDYASRYWTLSNTGLTTYSYTGSYTYAASDVIGTESLYKASRWNGSTWTAIAASSAVANTVSITTAQTQASSPLSGDYAARYLVPATQYTWTGTVDTEWNTPGNWDVNQVPNSCAHNVIVPSNPPSGNYPAIDVLVSVGNIQVGNNSRITLDANLNVCGNWTGAPATAAIILGNGSVVLQGSTQQTLSGSTQFNTVRVNNTAGVQVQAGAAVEVFTALELQTGTFAAGTNLVTFRSTSATEIAILNNFSSGFNGTLTGSIKAQRYYDSPAAQSFSQHFMGSPVDAPAVSQFGAAGVPGVVQPLHCWIDSFATGSPYGSMYEYIEANGATCGVKVWSSITSGNTVNGKGYSVARNGAGTLTVNGAPNLNSTYSVSGLGNSNYSTQASYIRTAPLTTVTINSGWHLVANPYLATLNVTTHAANSAFDAQIQVWEATGPFAGTYRPRMTNSNAVLAPFQAVLVHKTAVGGSATYNLYASDRSTQAATFYRQANQSELKITALNTTTGLLDETFVAFNTDATTQFDAEYDANKVQGSNTRHSLYTVAGSDDYAINTLNNVTQTATVPMSMRPGVDATFKFTVDGINTFDATQYVYLEDKTTGQMIDLRQNPEYTFNMTTAEAFDRFVLHFTPAATIAATDATCDAQGTIEVTQPGTANWNYTVTDANNTTVSSGTLNQGSPVTVHAATGVYTVTLTDANNYTVARNVMVSGTNAANATFSASATTVEEGSDVVFTANQAGATYTWNLGNGTTASGSGVTMAYTTPGVYTVELTVTTAGGCTATSTQLVTVNAKVETGVKDLSDASIKLWSNTNKVYVDFGKVKMNNATVSIYNLLGQELSRDNVNGVLYVKEVTQLEAGYILVRVENNGSITTKKLLIANK